MTPWILFDAQSWIYIERVIQFTRSVHVFELNNLIKIKNTVYNEQIKLNTKSSSSFYSVKRLRGRQEQIYP